MREYTPSRTASWVAVARGLGSALPPETRLAEDRFGIAFAEGHAMRTLLRIAPKRLLTEVPGAREWILYMQVRTRLLDDAVRGFVAGGGDQVVLLGAGYDCRAHRLEALAQAKVFEVDHPATQRHKREIIASLGAADVSRYLSWNFLEEPMSELPAALTRMGHDRTRPTLTIWEGVTMYLTEPALDASMKAIADYSAEGSRLAMTYFLERQVARPGIAMRALKRVLSAIGEPWTWGFRPGTLGAWLGARGFVLEEDVGMDEAAARLFPTGTVRFDAHRRVAFADKENVALAAKRAT